MSDNNQPIQSFSTGQTSVNVHDNSTIFHIELITISRAQWLEKQDRIKELEATEAKLRYNIEKLNDKYTESLENHQKEVKEYKEQLERVIAENFQLREQVKSLEEQVKSLEEQVKTNVEDISELKKYIGKQKRKHYKLLLGSIGYNLLDRIRETVFGLNDLDQNRIALKSIKDIKNHLRDEDTQKFIDFENLLSEKIGNRMRLDRQKEDDFLDYEEVLKMFTQNRTDIAHPTTLSEDSEEDEQEITKEDLFKVIQYVYPSKKSKKSEIPGLLLQKY